ncbi:solute carrier organic anion transporter family member 1B3-like isoform X2 [Hemicordylus capensis]|uniref:solute carrier organic anion transporter family member 1B3-like isoform X2 n=1 Tax=Hemicordylus capensis TaxID=884348 RepID=UPI002303CE45|nr:solute carrier organic anion transporter family member 1B3-like isoform X2 [Hemicordylus capensis]
MLHRAEGNLLVISFVSYFGAKLHRPRIIALGCFIMSLGSILAAMPHFIMGRYKYETIYPASDNSTFGISPCSADQALKESKRIPGLGCEKEDSSYAWIAVYIGNILRGIGETPITPLGISYLDDFSKEEDTPMYIGGLHTIAMIGPIGGFLLGSLLARLYVDIGFVDLGTITITPADSRWVGAWWLGFLVAAVLNLTAAIPFCFLPKSLNKDGENPHSKTKTATVTMDGDQQQIQKSESQQGVDWAGKLKGFFKSLKRIFGNKMYFVLLCYSLLQFSSFIGYLTYNPKYMEQQYGQTASKSNFITGVAVLPVVSISIFLGGFIMKKYKLSIVSAAKMAFLSAFMAFLISLLYIVVGCENRTVAGLTVSYDGQPVARGTIPLSSACNANCTCATNQWDPVCGANGITYVSACFAGCKNTTGSQKDTVFHNCDCIEKADFATRNSSAVLGECPRSDGCTRKFIYFVAIKILSSFFYALGGTPLYMVMIRCVPQELKSLAIGINILIMRALGGIPAPVYFGAVIDLTCLKWASTGCGQQGACRLYDSTAYRYYFLSLIYGLRAPAFLLGLVFFLLVKKHFGGKGTPTPENGKKEDVPLNEEAKSNGNELVVRPSDGDKDSCI